MNLVNPKTFTVLCDVDGVVGDLVTPLRSGIFESGLGYLLESEIKHHDFRLSFNEAQCKAAHEIMAEAGFCYGIPPYDGAFEFIDEVHEEYNLLFVTSPYPSPTWVEERRQWCQDKLGVHSRRVLSVASEFKQYVRGDVLIEDRPDVLAAWCDANPAGLGILIDRPWNQLTSKEFPTRYVSNMWRVASYDEALENIHGKYENLAERLVA